jgi:Xaa-Pro aminopeptidase
MDYPGRQIRLRSVFGENRLDALLVTHLPNVRYLCGFTGSAAVLLLTEKGSVFFSDGRYTAQARAEVRGARIAIAGKSPLIAAGEWLAAHRRKLGGNRRRRLGIEAEHLTVASYGRLAKLAGSDFRLQPSPALVEQARMVKDADEVERIRAAAALGAGLFETVLAAIRPGVKEAEVAAEMEYAARKAGADGMSFPTIIASGKRSALPHGQASEARIPSNGFVVCDFGVILSGYCSDRTRTIYVGRPSQEARRLYEAVREAEQAALDAVRPGRAVAEVDGAARKLLQKRGLAKYFTHSTGHGVGLEIHEAPRVAARQTEILRPGMVITVEPGVYLPGQWGIRIEDMVVVTEQGCEVLSPTSKELIAI